MKIAIASGKGGTGKTFVSTNLFASLQDDNKVVTIIDCDAEEPNVTRFLTGEQCGQSFVNQDIPVIDSEKCAFCGKCSDYCNYNAIMIVPSAKYINVIEDLCHDCGACYYACTYDAISAKKKIVGEVNSYRYSATSTIVEARIEVGTHSAVPVIKSGINTAADSDLVIMDSPPGISCPFITTVDRADYVILLTEPTPFGLNDLKLSVSTLQELNKPFGVVVNRAGLGDDDVFNYLKNNDIELLLEIPFDKEIAKIYSKGSLLVEHHPQWKEKFKGVLCSIIQQFN